MLNTPGCFLSTPHQPREREKNSLNLLHSIRKPNHDRTPSASRHRDENPPLTPLSGIAFFEETLHAGRRSTPTIANDRIAPVPFAAVSSACLFSVIEL